MPRSMLQGCRLDASSLIASKHSEWHSKSWRRKERDRRRAILQAQFRSLKVKRFLWPQTPCDDNDVAEATGQGDVVVDEAYVGVTGDVVVDAQQNSVPAAVLGINDDETRVEPEASSADAAPSCYTGSKLSETVCAKWRETHSTVKMAAST